MRKTTLNSKLTRKKTPHAMSERMQQYTEYWEGRRGTKLKVGQITSQILL